MYDRLIISILLGTLTIIILVILFDHYHHCMVIKPFKFLHDTLAIFCNRFVAIILLLYVGLLSQ